MTTDLGRHLRGNEETGTPARPAPLAACPQTQRTDVASELAAAIAGGGLSLEYQPLVDLRSYRVDGMEALARWWVPSEGWRPPDRWIPIAEERGLIIPFGRWALSTVLQQIAALRSRGHGRIPVAVNLSPLQLDDLGFVDFLGAAFGGPVVYLGRTMQMSHEGLGITEEEWRRFIEHVEATLRNLAIAEREAVEFLGAAESLKAEIVETAPVVVR